MAQNGWFNHSANQNLMPRIPVPAPQKSQIPGLGYNIEDSSEQDTSRRLRKQWFQQNDLDYYGQQSENKIMALPRENSFEQYDHRQTHFDGTATSGNDHHLMDYGDSMANYKISHGGSGGDGYDDYPVDNNQVSDMKPDWLKNEDTDNYGNQYHPNNSNNNGYKSPIPTQSENRQTFGHPMADCQKGDSRNVRLMTPTNQLHKRFSSNPALATKSPFAMDYTHNEAVMSESGSVFGKSRPTGWRNAGDVPNFPPNDNNPNADNRLKSYKSPKSEMSKLLSFGYMEKPNERNFQSADGNFDARKFERQVSNLDDVNNFYAHQGSYKPTCIEKAESSSSLVSSTRLNGNENRRQNSIDDRPEMFKIGPGSREPSASYGRKKSSFDGGRPDFFTNLTNENTSGSSGKPPMPDSSFIDKFNRSSLANTNKLDGLPSQEHATYSYSKQDLKNNFRRRKIDLNLPVTSPMRPSQRR